MSSIPTILAALEGSAATATMNHVPVNDIDVGIINCFLCGVAFNISRIRTIYEPRGDGWTAETGGKGWAQPVYNNPYDCSSDHGCATVHHVVSSSDPLAIKVYDRPEGGMFVVGETRTNSTLSEQKTLIFAKSHPVVKLYDEDFRDPIIPESGASLDIDVLATSILNTFEHIAGPRCIDPRGFNGHDIKVRDMLGSNNWITIEWDTAAEGSFLHSIGLEQGEFMPAGHRFRDWIAGPMSKLKHAREFTRQDTFQFKSRFPVVVHPGCLDLWEIFTRAGGKGEFSCRMKIEDLLRVRDTEWTRHGYPGLEDVVRRTDVYATTQPHKDDHHLPKFYHKTALAYLAANPVVVPDLQDFLASKDSEICQADRPLFDVMESPFKTRDRQTSVSRGGFDIFMGVMEKQPAIILGIAKHLGKKDLANMRLVSPAFHRFPLNVWFQDFVNEDFPYLFEAWKKPAADIRLKHSIELAARAGLSLPARLDADTTNWYNLYVGLKKHGHEILGLRNRQRIWDEMTQLTEYIDKKYEDGWDENLLGAPQVCYDEEEFRDEMDYLEPYGDF